MRLNILGYFEAQGGYGRHAAQTIRWIERLTNCYVTLRAINHVDPNRKEPELADIRQRLVNGQQPEPGELIIAPPRIFPTPHKRTAYFTMNESTRMQPVSVEYMNRSKVVVVPSTWCASCFSANGVRTPIRVVPLGVDTAVFGYRPTTIPGKVIRFGCGGVMSSGENRKGLAMICESFLNAFYDVENVELQVKVTSRCKPDYIPEAPNIKLIEKDFTDHEMADWYRQLNCYVSVSTGGWELMPHEALAVGCPVMAPQYGGIAEYLTDQNGYLLHYKLNPAKDAWVGLGDWAVPDAAHMVQAMRWVYSDPHVALRKGYAGAEQMSGYTWERSVRGLIEALYEFDIIEKPKPTRRTSDKKLYVQLGRYGDIINILPILYRSHARKENPTLLVSKDYAPIAESIGYCDWMVYDGEFEDLPQAIDYAEHITPDLVVTQTVGRGHAEKLVCSSFNKESWRKAGELDQWGMDGLYFGNRDYNAEKELADEFLSKEKPNILINLDGYSSPYAGADRLEEFIRENFEPEANVVPLHGIQALRIDHMLGLLDRGDILITVDSALLHLAEASNIPTVALVASEPSLWHGTDPRCNLLGKYRYGRGQIVPLEHIATFIRSVIPREFPRMIHVYSDYPSKDDETIRRNRIAYKTWKRQYRYGRWVESRVFDKTLSRVFKDSETRVLPYIKDLIGCGVKQADSDEDIIVLTNADTCFGPYLTRLLIASLKTGDASYAFRRDFKRVDRELTQHEISRGKQYVGNDLLAFRVRWWEKHKGEFPDMLLGTEAWDACFRHLITETHPKSVRAVTDAIYHERHDTVWEVQRLTLASQKQNRHLAKAFFKKRGKVYE